MMMFMISFYSSSELGIERKYKPELNRAVQSIPEW